MIEVVHAGNADDIQLVRGIANECIENGKYLLFRCYAFSIFLLFSYSLILYISLKILKNSFVVSKWGKKKKDNHIVTWKIINIVEVVIVDFKIVINIFE